MGNNITYDASQDVKMEERNSTETVREVSSELSKGDIKVGKIKSYKFNILVRDQPSLTGELSREQMNLICSLYSSEGSNLSQREVSRNFPELTFRDFKKILRAFNITKSCSPFAPHVIEERDVDSLITLTLKNKEDSYLRKLEQDRARLTEVKYKEMVKQYYDLKNSIDNFKDFVAGLRIDVRITPKVDLIHNDTTIMVYLSDMHVGADVSSYSIYDNNYNMSVMRERMNSVINEVCKLTTLTNAGNVVVCNLGDSLDGYNGETTRGGHLLPQNMNNKEQFKNYLTLMLELFSGLTNNCKCGSIKYVCVEGGNHDGDFGYLANKALEATLCAINPNISVEIFDKFIGHFTVGTHTFMLCHGKDAKDMFKNLPLTINDKSENQINEYIDYKGLTGNIHFVKGDLHQSAKTHAKRFRYKSVGSFFGSSEWIHKNFGNTKACVDFDIVNGETVMESRIVLN